MPRQLIKAIIYILYYFPIFCKGFGRFFYLYFVLNNIKAKRNDLSAQFVSFYHILWRYFSFDLQHTPIIRPNTMAAVMPAEAAESPPVTAPRSPFVSTASRTPSARALPKPVRGTAAPAPAKSMRGRYILNAPSTTPATT